MKSSMIINLLTWLTALLLGACVVQSAPPVPVEEEQIENVVKEYFVRDTTVPDYDVTIEEVASNWARVSINPAGTEGATSTLYLQKQGGVDDVSTATVAEAPGNDARVGTTTGWTVILGPQVEFNEAKLDEVGIPNTVRP